DDRLTEEELDVMSGVTRIYTEQDNQLEDRSWWPKHNVWRTSGMYTGIWTPKNEHWFQTRLAEIRRGGVGPMNVRQWRS
ncbi:hypothetical protein C8Q76DRAFT_600356, partial [Earliella scabrosa]